MEVIIVNNGTTWIEATINNVPVVLVLIVIGLFIALVYSFVKEINRRVECEDIIRSQSHKYQLAVKELENEIKERQSKINELSNK